MTIWFTADTHFGHANIIKYCHRPFKDVDEMDMEIIRRWNSLVTQNDVVFHLGDFAFKNPSKYANLLNGILRVIPGTHDTNLHDVARIILLDPLVLLKQRFMESQYGMSVDAPVVLCHYAMRVWEKSHFNSYHLYGHSHGSLPGVGRSMDVGVDTNDFMPYSLADVFSRLSEKNNPNLVLTGDMR